MTQFKNILFLFSVFLFLQQTVSANEELVEIKTPRGVTQKYLLLEPEAEPKAIVLLFAGGKGALNLGKGMFGNSIGWGKRNFLIRSRKQFAGQGFIVVTVDAPSDKQGKNGMYYEFRTSDDHVQDIDTVIETLKQNNELPVWLIGTSRGTESAAYIGMNSRQKLAGIVLTSSMTEENGKGLAVTELPLSRVNIPVLITHHKDDGCKWTTPDGAGSIKNLLTSAPKVELKLFEGGYEQGKPCKAMSHHGYLGIENEVIKEIADFIKSNS